MIKETNTAKKNKISLPSQYSISFSGFHDEVFYIIVPIKLHVGKYMDSGLYVCDVLYYNTGTWWNGDDDTITNYSGYPYNIYNYLSNENQQKRRKISL